MIDNLSYIAENRVLISYNYNEKNRQILFSDLSPFWNELSKEFVEDGIVFIFGNKIVFSIIIASGQGGIIAIWDAKNNCLCHISEASFCISFNIIDSYIYYLKEVNYYGMPVHYLLYRTKMGIIDANKEGEQLFCDNPRKLNKEISNYDSIKIEIINN